MLTWNQYANHYCLVGRTVAIKPTFNNDVIEGKIVLHHKYGFFIKRPCGTLTQPYVASDVQQTEWLGWNGRAWISFYVIAEGGK